MMHTDCCLLVCLRPPEHRRLVNNLYPRLDERGAKVTGVEMDLKPAECGRFCSYAVRYPDKLDISAAYLVHKLEIDLAAGRHGHVAMLMRALQELIEECKATPSHLNLFEHHVITTVALLLRHSNTGVHCAAADTLRTLIVAQDERADLVGKFGLFVDSMLSLCAQGQDDGAVAGFKVLAALVPVLLAAPENAAKTVPVLLHAMQRGHAAAGSGARLVGR